MKLEILETVETKNGRKYLIFFSSEEIKTYAWLWEEQLSEIKDEVSIKKGIEEKVNLFTKKYVLENNTYFNTFWIPILKKGSFGKGKKDVLCFKKHPLLNSFLDDKPSLIHNKKTLINKKNASTFVSFSFKSTNPYSLLNQMADIKSVDELMAFLYGEIKNEKTFIALKKNLLENIIYKPFSDRLDINFIYLRTVLLLKQKFSQEFMKEIFTTPRYSKLLKSNLYKDFLYSPISSPKINVSKGILEYCFKKEGVKTEDQAFNELLKFNVPPNHLMFFNEMMDEPFNHFQPKIKDDALYFMNNISRSWGRLKNKNFDIPFNKNESFSWLKKINNKKSKQYSFKVPEKYHELISWSEKPRNCLGNSNASDTYSYRGLIGVFENQELKWVLSVDSRNKIEQFEGFKASLPSKEQQKEVLGILSKLSGLKIEFK